MPKGKVPFKQGLWTKDEKGDYRLLGEKCSFCGEVFFPPTSNNFCSCCQKKDGIEKKLLAKEGEISTFTIIRQSPSGGYYKGEIPFAYGLIDLPEVRVKSLLCNDYDKMSIGEKVSLTIIKIYEDDENEYFTYAFQLVN
ncbi:Zn-ribbon domain-containing OB-fold protein [Natranaerofaba carboxydovora]|uniref:Zn-ribbon domain-containing OB-fold protein n=1 Tax=Natranaerofaba carboxydovora TaxID=2742683 RepID=UPI001F12CF74|nr:OB-fold domain-containing protein [Natranaerofaba carboxydovora]